MLTVAAEETGFGLVSLTMFSGSKLLEAEGK